MSTIPEQLKAIAASVAHLYPEKIDPNAGHRIMGKCTTCGHKLWMHYEPYCPICRPPQENEKPHDVSHLWTEIMDKTDQRAFEKGHFGLMRVLYYIEAYGLPDHHAKLPQPAPEHCVWHAIIKAQERAGYYHSFGNDRVCKLTFDDRYYDKHEVIQAWTLAVRTIIGKDEADFWVSW